MRVQPVILAAGKGTRMGSADLPKVLVEVGGKPLIQYLLDTLKETPFFNATIVVGFQAAMVERELGGQYRYVLQESQLGTGHAVQACAQALHGVADTILVLYGDQPLITSKSMQRLLTAQAEQEAVLSVLTVVSDQDYFKKFGRILRDSEGNITAIREYKDATEEERAVEEYNTGIYAFSDDWLWKSLQHITPENAQHEFYLTDLIAMAIKQGKTVATVAVEEWHEALGVNTPEQLAAVQGALGL